MARYLRRLERPSPSRANRYARYRAPKQAKGLREVRLLVPDVNAPGFQGQLNAQIDRINASEDEREVMIFCDLAAEEMWRELD